MRPLPTAQHMLSWLCICSDESSLNRLKKLAYICFSVAIIMVFLSLEAASTLYALRYKSIDLTKSLATSPQVLGWLPLLYMFLAALILRHKIIDIFKKLNDIYDQREYLFKKLSHFC